MVRAFLSVHHLRDNSSGEPDAADGQGVSGTMFQARKDGWYLGGALWIGLSLGHPGSFNLAVEVNSSPTLGFNARLFALLDLSWWL